MQVEKGRRHITVEIFLQSTPRRYGVLANVTARDDLALGVRLTADVGQHL
jgi:hypothetical protein